jgi:hypothetical protein
MKTSKKITGHFSIYRFLFTYAIMQDEEQTPFARQSTYTLSNTFSTIAAQTEQASRSFSYIS